MSAIDDEALDWVLRMAEPDADWAAFTTWLETDPRHAEHYNRATLDLEEATRLVTSHEATWPEDAANDHDAPAPGSFAARPRVRGWLGSVVAAALVGAIGLGIWHERDQSYTLATAMGEQRTVQFADGSSIVLAGGSRVRLDQSQPRSATVEAGKMLFRVRHHAEQPFEVRVRNLTLTDLGTVFDVRLLEFHTHVSVAEGAVMVASKGAAVRLDPGQGIVSDGETIQREQLDVAEIGSWQNGRLAYDKTTLREVADDLSRQLGVRITASPTVAARRFNGTLEMSWFRDNPALLGDYLGVDVRHDASGWILDAPR